MMHVHISRRGLYVLWRMGDPDGDPPPLGFVVKPTSHRLFSERYGGYRRAWRIGPLYVRGYARKAIHLCPECSK